MFNEGIRTIIYLKYWITSLLAIVYKLIDISNEMYVTESSFRLIKLLQNLNKKWKATDRIFLLVQNQLQIINW